ncbi:MAG: MerR family transcriptional regulator [Parvularcula sp.]|jgi:hypothetical protein|nr:MerR family transcriptional regulator [Parvularcula sp.]
MRLVKTRQALRLTGLSAPTLREWTSRRALIPADVPPKTQGSPAQYSWQTILLLRLAATLRDRFHVELQAHRTLLASLHHGFHGRSFVGLWDRALVLQGGDKWLLIDTTADPLRQDSIIIQLDPHLLILSEGFALPKPAGIGRQLDLFPAAAVGKSVRRTGQRTSERQRRSA